jgi:hypothetical protein
MSFAGAGLAALVLACIPARAAETASDKAFEQKLFGKAIGNKKANVCFKRVYNEDHLAQHPQQNVRAMLLMATADMDPDSGRTYSVSLGVRGRKGTTQFESQGYCGSLHDEGDASPKPMHCGVDCDGGSIDVTLKDEKTMLVSIPIGARLWRPDDQQDPPVSHHIFGADDKIFRLERANLSECLSIVHDDKERAAIRRGK